MPSPGAPEARVRQSERGLPSPARMRFSLHEIADRAILRRMRTLLFIFRSGSFAQWAASVRKPSAACCAMELGNEVKWPTT